MGLFCLFGAEQAEICFKVHLQRDKITGLQITCLHLVEALGFHFVVTHGNPAPSKESSPVIYSRAGNPALSQLAFLRAAHSS